MQFGYDIVGLAEHLGVKPATIRTYRYRGLLPDPDMMIGQSPYWLNATIHAWKQTRQQATA